MRENDRRRVLAIAIDAAEPTLVRQLIERGELPTLERLLAEGSWNSIASPAFLGSGAVWPTFITGTEPALHGIYGEWCWQPEEMAFSRVSGRSLTPFWDELNRSGKTIGLFDVPFAPVLGLDRGFEISEWGAHDVLEGQTRAFPAARMDCLLEAIGPHPFSARRVDVTGRDDYSGLARLGALCHEGIKLRGELAAQLISDAGPDLSIIVFPELHTAMHHLWHTLERDHPFFANDGNGGEQVTSPAIEDIVREIDTQISRLIEAAGENATVIVFSLHGMRPTRGIPAALGPLLTAWGYASRAGWRSQSWGERGRTIFAAAKRRAPAGLKRLYYDTVPQTVTHRVAQTTLAPAYDWTRTRAFSLPTDQHGWIRLNLEGRERNGIVPVAAYDDTCRELMELLRTVETKDGRRLVRECVQLSGGGAPAPDRLPDIVIHWDDAAFDDPLRTVNPDTYSRPIGMKFTGQHAFEGFCISKGTSNGHQTSITAQDLHRLMIGALRD